MSSALIALLLLDELVTYGAENGFDGLREYENFLHQEARSKRLRGRRGYQLAVKRIAE